MKIKQLHFVYYQERMNFLQNKVPVYEIQDPKYKIHWIQENWKLHMSAHSNENGFSI